MQDVQERPMTDAPVATPAAARVPVGSPVYNAILEHLYEEAALLDQIKLQEWGATLATDLIYTAPLRETRGSSHQAKTYVRTMQHFHDDYRSVMGRILRLTGKSAWAEDPPSRTRRLVTNVLVHGTANADEFAVVSYLLITRSRFNFDERLEIQHAA